MSSSFAAAPAEAVPESKKVETTTKAPRRSCRLQRQANAGARALVAGVAVAAVAVVSLLAVALSSFSATTEGPRYPQFVRRAAPEALVWQVKKFSGRAVLFDFFALSASSSAALSSSRPSTRAAAAAEKEGGEKFDPFSSFLLPVNEFDEDSARLGVEPFSSLAADAVAALSSASSGNNNDDGGGGGGGKGRKGGGRRELPPGLWHLDRLDSRSPPLDGALFDPSGAGLPQRGGGVTVYVVDSGVSVGHSEFLEDGGGGGGGSSSSPSSRASEGPDFSFANGVLASSSSSFNSSSSSSPSPSSPPSPALLGDCDGHGTHVASLASGRNAGVAPRARVVSLRVIGCDGKGRASSLVAALRFVAREGARPAVVVLSLGGGEEDPGEELELGTASSALRRARRHRRGRRQRPSTPPRSRPSPRERSSSPRRATPAGTRVIRARGGSRRSSRWGRRICP